MSALSKRLAAAAAAIAMIALGAAGCGSRPAPSAPPASPSPQAPAGSPRAVTPRPAPGAPRPAPGTPSPSVPAASAARQLAGFFAAAEGADARLHHAAVLVNGGISTHVMHFTPTIRAAVEAVDVAGVARQIPAGMPPELLRQVLLVYSDLDSRYLAFRRVIEYREPSIPVAALEGRDVLSCLANGAPAAGRFAGDLASARSQARATPPFAVMPVLSAAAAEVAIRVAVIDEANGGCDECGGAVVTTLWPVAWRTRPGPGVTRASGTIGTLEFDVEYQPARGWLANPHAC